MAVTITTAATSTAPYPFQQILQPCLAWARVAIDERLNGLLLNWYDAELAHRIVAHRDSIAGLVEGAPIVTISLGATPCLPTVAHEGEGICRFRGRAWDRVCAAVGDHPASQAWGSAPDSRHGPTLSITIRAFET